MKKERLYINLDIGNAINSYFSIIALFINVFLINTLEAQRFSRYEYQEPKMGTTFRFVFYAQNDSIANQVAQLAFAKIDSLNLIFSDYETQSEVNQLSNYAGTRNPIKVSQPLWEVLTLAKHISQKSNGVYDVTIGTLSKLWRRAFRRKTFPNYTHIQTAQSLVNYKWLKLNKRKRTVYLCKKGMRLDLGGIAKGYTIDQVFGIFKQFGITSVLIDGGGDLYFGDPPPSQKGWTIKMMINDTTDQVIQLHNQAIASSGNTYRYLTWNGKKYSHIIHPKTGLGITTPSIINVTAPSCTLADVLASTLSLLSPKERIKFIRKFENCKMY